MTEFFHGPAFDWDKHLFQFINSHNTPFWDKVLWVITSPQFGVLYFLILSLLVIFFYRKHSWKILLFVAVVTLFADAFGARVLKPTVQRLRPSHDPEYFGDYQVHLIQRKDGTFYYGGKYSFPSNHAINYLTSSILFFYFLSPKIKRRKLLASIILGTILVICYTRPYVGVHYPTDILCGWLIAFLMAGLGIWIVNLRQKGIGKRE